MKDLISVVIPVYNVEEYLDRCIESVINQTYKNLEIIIVDVGSTDNSGNLCDKWANVDSRIKVYHKENAGLSSARNFGIKKSTGEYIAFLDSDDFLNLSFYEKLLNYLKKSKSSIVISGVMSFSNINEIKKHNQEEFNLEILEGLDKFKYLEKGKVLDTVLASNKLYRKELFKEIHYPEGKIHEDAFIIHYLLDLSKRIVYTNEKLFYYFKRSNSITSTYNLKRLDEIEALKDRLNFFCQDKFINTPYKEFTYISYVGYLIKHYFLLNYHNDNYSKEIKLIKKEYNNNYFKIMKCNVNIQSKLKYTLVRYFPKLYLLLKSLEVEDAD